MAIAIASKSSMVASSTPSVVVTKPTGVATGDLLLIFAAGSGYGTPTGGDTLLNYSANSGVVTCTGFSEATYVSYDPNRNSGVGGVARINVLYKIAVLADESAANYTVSWAYGGGAAIMYRITGWTTGNPFAYITNTSIAVEPRGGVNQDGSATLSWGNAAPSNITSRPSQQVLFYVVSTDGDEDSGFTYSNFATVPSETFTEDGDTTYAVTPYDGGAFAVATATSSATTDITSASVYKTYDSSDGGESTAYALLAVFTPINGSATAALHSISPTFYANTGTSDAAATHALLSVSPTVNAGSGSAVTSAWTERSKNTTTWTPRI